MVSRILFVFAVFCLTSCATDSIENRQSGQMLICHNGNKTLTVSNADSFVHLQHGDSVGPCPADSD